jgi:hypothetical protein
MILSIQFRFTIFNTIYHYNNIWPISTQCFNFLNKTTTKNDQILLWFLISKNPTHPKKLTWN